MMSLVIHGLIVISAKLIKIIETTKHLKKCLLEVQAHFSKQMGICDMGICDIKGGLDGEKQGLVIDYK